VKRLVFKSVSDVTTRLAMLKRGEVDAAYTLLGEIGEEVRRTPGLTLRPTRFTSTHWILFADQWDANSPWHDRRVRLAATHAVDRQAINQAESLGFSKITGSIIPTSFEFYWQPPVYPYDLAKAKQLLAEAGYPKGFDAGDLSTLAICGVTCRRAPPPRPCSTHCRESGSRCGSGQWSAQHSSRCIRRRNSRTSSTA